MANKRYFFVHLAILAGLCSTFAIAGLSSYRDYLEIKKNALAAQRAEPAGVPSTITEETREMPASRGPDWSGPEAPVLVLSGYEASN